MEVRKYAPCAALCLRIIFWVPAAECQNTTASTLPGNVEIPGNGTAISQVASADVECSGHLAPRSVFALQLRPGERVEKLSVKAGDRVEKGDLLVQLDNDALLERRSVLQEKQLSIIKSRDEIGLLDTRLELLTKSVDRINKWIENERTIMARAGQQPQEKDLRPWLEKLRENQDALLVLKIERTLAEKRLAFQVQNETVLADLFNRLDRQINILTIRAPFAGRIAYINDNCDRAAQNERILELWEDQILMVHASVWQHQFSRIHIGSRAKVFPNFFQDVWIWGTVKTLGPSGSIPADSGFPIFPLTIELDRVPAGVISGMAVNVKIMANQNSGAKLP